MNNNNELVQKDTIIKCIQNYVLLDDKIKELNSKTKELREKKNVFSKYICDYIDNNNVNKSIKISDGELKINERKDYTPLSYNFIEECLSEIIKDENKVSYIIDYLKEKREIKTSLEIKRVKK
tara:strand:+ start:187 stop:555 length:369 start_codon:yes stop_codon:yes gene_type:complete